ncbi:MAG: YafY family protein [Bacteroidota bacterium]
MEKEKPRLARLTAILTQLQSKRLVTAREMSEKHDVSIRTIYRDIRTLEQSGIPIYTEEGKGYTIMEGYHLPPVMFSEAEANAMITAAQIISKNKDQSLVEQYASAIEKVKAVLKGNQQEKSELLSNRLEIRINYNSEKSSNYLIKIQAAITNFQLVTIQYTSEKGEASQREIEPFALIHTQGNWVLIAHCRLREDFRAFRLDRMQQLIVQSEYFEPHGISLQEYYDQARIKWKKDFLQHP